MGESAPSPLTAARMLLVGDVVARAHTVLHGHEVRCVAVARQDELAPSTRLNVGRPLGLQCADTAGQAADMLGGKPSIIIAPLIGPSHADDTSEEPGPQTILVGRVMPAPSAASALLTAGEHDSCAARLMLLHFQPDEAAHVSLPRRRRAEETLDRWRLRVAMWEELPDALPDPKATTALTEALGTGLNAQGTLVILHRLESDLTVPSGAKYAVFRCIDEILGLDLGHLVGKLRH